MSITEPLTVECGIMRGFRRKPADRPSDPIHVHIRWLSHSDIKDVMEIESSTPNPSTASEIVRMYRERHSIGMVAVHNDFVVGYFIYKSESTHLFVEKLAVHPAFRRRTVGRQMMDKLRSKATTYTKLLRLMVRESNLDGCRFLAACGLRAVGVAWGEYGTEDGYLFRLTPGIECGAVAGLVTGKGE